jgi:pimeloyl-ACP methyl ester carboxylesterase
LSRRRRRLSALLLAGALAGAPAAAAMPTSPGGASLVRILVFGYRAHDGLRRLAVLVLPRWYGPRRHPPLPLVISPHGRGVDAMENAAVWRGLPARGPFALVSPDGQGRRLERFSWGDRGQIDDLARMPRLVRHAFPWLRLDGRVYAVGESMGGQETLLLLARHPHLLSGAVAFDAPTRMRLRYQDFRLLRNGLRLQRLARLEIGGTPRQSPRLYADRSPLVFARRIAFSGVPLQLWWSRRDRVVVDQARQSGLLYRLVEWLNPRAPVTEYVGGWAHTAEVPTRLPLALVRLGLLRPHGRVV